MTSAVKSKRRIDRTLATPITDELMAIAHSALARCGVRYKLAEAIGMSGDGLRKILQGKNTYIHKDIVEALCEIAGVPDKKFKYYTREQLRLAGYRVDGHRVNIRKIDGIWHKQCNGVRCNGAWQPLKNFYKRPNTNVHRPSCKECESRVHHAGFQVLLKPRYYMMVVSLVNRLGFSETARRIGTDPNTIRRYMGYKSNWKYQPKRIHNKRAGEIVKAWAEVQTNDEVWHKDSIFHGAKVRGREVKRPKNASDLFRPYGDTDGEFRKAYRERTGK